MPIVTNRPGRQRLAFAVSGFAARLSPAAKPDSLQTLNVDMRCGALRLASVRPPRPNPKRNPAREPTRHDLGRALELLDHWMEEHPLLELST